MCMFVHNILSPLMCVCVALCVMLLGLLYKNRTNHAPGHTHRCKNCFILASYSFRYSMCECTATPYLSFSPMASLGEIASTPQYMYASMVYLNADQARPGQTRPRTSGLFGTPTHIKCP